MATILDTSPDGSITTYKEEDDKILLDTVHPDTSKLEQFNVEHMASRTRFDKKCDMHHIMRVPTAVLTKIANDTGLDFFNPEDAKAILRILKGSEYSKFRTYSGNI